MKSQCLVLGTAAVVISLCCYVLYDFDNSNTPVRLSREAPPEIPADVPLNELYQFHSLSKDLIVHSAYFDPRPRNGFDNVTILFINVNVTILYSQWIIGCGANGIRTSNFSVYSIFENELMHDYLGPTPFMYENQLILCYNLPAPDGSSVFAVYKTSADSLVEMFSYSRQPLFHPEPRVLPTGEDEFTVLVCSKIHDKNAPWIREFIQYQKTLGVDHIDFSVLDTFISDGYQEKVLEDPVVLDALEEGFINFRVWPDSYLNEGEVYLHSEILRKLGCIYRYLGTYDYVIPLDTDDFFNPVSDTKNLKDYIKEYCYENSVGSCSFKWVRFYPDCGLLGDVGPDGNVTASLKVMAFEEQKNLKSIHKSVAILDASFHDANCTGCLVSGYQTVSVPSTEAYVAHLRFGLFKSRVKHYKHFKINRQYRNTMIQRLCPYSYKYT